ncbi:hypothetical protein F3Y22_tig00110403pilonHSYRG00157 [Hibiscus syriacus]|uniref:Uncharacterized protein n=1 Tax=Hibiscus syriacus TaxID=106335 RepID=A0A6A3ANJ6_HIBSY|nr:hypothetical protein F3Y22_tig00110403pilonHSYRG00157 [Hibiscus syriacus]
MGLDGWTNKFLETAVALKAMSTSTLEKKFDAFRRWGLSDQEIHPSCMLVSVDNIMDMMDFLVNKVGYSSTLVAKQSSIFARSLEKRIVPRALFVRELLSRGLADSVRFSMVFDSSEKDFP